MTRLNIKAENGGKFYDYTITKEDWLKVTGSAFDAELQAQREAKKETVKAGGCVSGFLHAYGVTTAHDEKSTAAGNPSAFPETDGEFGADEWLVAWNHSSGRASTLESRQAAYDKKIASMKADGLTEAMIAKYAGKRPEAKS